jgi:hypothetical protein
MGNDKLTGGVDGVGGEIERKVMEAVPGRQRGVGCEGADVVKGEFDVGKEVRPTVRWERDMAGGEDGDNVVFGGAYCTLRREGTVIVGGDILVGDVGGDKEGSKVS